MGMRVIALDWLFILFLLPFALGFVVVLVGLLVMKGVQALGGKGNGEEVVGDEISEQMTEVWMEMSMCEGL
jgi:hypothetical protein